MKDIDIIGVALNLGANREGVEKGFSTLKSRLDLKEIFKSHNLFMERCVESPSFISLKHDSNELMKNREEIFQCNLALADKTFESIEKGHLPLVIGGDHSLSWGSISGVSKSLGKIGCIYIDAHGDFNTAELSPSHNVHGMHMAYLMGLTDSELNDFYSQGVKLDKNEVYFIGTRSLDYGEQDLAREHELKIFPTSLVKKEGRELERNIVQAISESSMEKFHLSLDIDVLDPEVAPGTGVPEVDGLNLEPVISILSEILKTGKIVSIDLVEFNPLLDCDDTTLAVCEKLLKTISESL